MTFGPSQGRKLFFSAGDASGDAHGAELLRELRRRDPQLSATGFGGPKLQEAGLTVLEPLAADPVMGFSRVARQLGRFLKLLSGADRWFAKHRPERVILIDYPGFNVNLGMLARRHGLSTFYYICPQYWAWAPWRTRRLRAAAEDALVIFPFERAFFERYGIAAHFTGHPLSDRMTESLASPGSEDAPCLAVLPGSRRQEVEALFPWMLDAARALQDRLGKPLSLQSAQPDPALRRAMEASASAAGFALKLLTTDLASALRGCRLALVASGTATLEVALLGVPAVVLYRVNPVLLAAKRWYLQSPFIAQPNLLAARELFPEIVSHEPPIARTVAAAETLWEGPERELCLRELRRLREAVLRPGVAARAAELLLPSPPIALGP